MPPDEILDLPLVAQTLDTTCGAACFESMFHYFKGYSLGEMHFARKLGTLDLGYTPPVRVAELARSYGFNCTLQEGSDVSRLKAGMRGGDVVFVTWWDEDAGHYSLVKSIRADSILLMDPWKAREGVDHRIGLDDFLANWRKRGSVMIRVSRP